MGLTAVCSVVAEKQALLKIESWGVWELKAMGLIQYDITLLLGLEKEQENASLLLLASLVFESIIF